MAVLLALWSCAVPVPAPPEAEAEPCDPLPPDLLGSWGTQAGLELACDPDRPCEVRRTARKVLLELQAPDRMEQVGEQEQVCARPAPSGGWLLDALPGKVLRVERDLLLIGDAAASRRPNRYHRLPEDPVPVWPGWAVGDFRLSDGRVLRTGDNDVWVLQDAGMAGLPGAVVAAGGLVPTGRPDRCVGLHAPRQPDQVEGDLCRVGDRLRFQPTHPERGRPLAITPSPLDGRLPPGR